MHIRVLLGCLSLVATASAASSLGVLPPVPLDPSVPPVDRVLGYHWGDEISDPEQMQRYAEALAKAAPERVKLVPYAKSFEGRQLFFLIVSHPETMAQLEEVAAAVRTAADPRTGVFSQKPASLPVVVWLAGSVHGDEPSGGEAVLALAYYLTAARSPEVDQLLRRVILVLDPMQNPDGRARFVTSTRQARGPVPDESPASAEHVQPWPGGRFSHYLFDLNRDWFALTHPETQGRVAGMLWLPPQVVVDLHEMGSDQGYFFPPPAQPYNPYVSGEQQKLWELVGRRLAAVFDRAGIRFWTRELYDAFYPGYGESWPFFSGACGATFEQASTRGLAVRLRSGEVMHYRDTVAHHLLAAFVTVQTAAGNTSAFWESFYAYRQKAVSEGTGSAYVWEAKGEGSLHLARTLARQGLEVFQPAQGPGAGSFVLPLGQPLGRLARVLLSKDVPLPKDFADQQVKREAKRLPDEIYDVTAWSLPLLWNVPVREEKVSLGEGARRVRVEDPLPYGVEGAGEVAFLLRWEGLSSVRALVKLRSRGVQAGVAEKAFTIAGQHFPMGTIVVRRRDNPENLRETVEEIAREAGVRFVGTNTSMVDSGIDLGSNRVRRVVVPKVALLWDAPSSPLAAGHIRYACEQQWGLHVTPLRANSLRSADLASFSVIVLPDGFAASTYAKVFPLEELDPLKRWVQEGGVLVAEGEAAVFLTSEKVGLLASSLEKRRTPGKGKDEEPSDKSGPPKDGVSSQYGTFGEPEDEQPPPVPGAICNVNLDTEHLLAAGFPDGKVAVIVNSRRVFTPLKLGKGFNIGVYAGEAELVASGFVFAESRKQLPQKAYLMVQRHGRGLVIAFAEPPAFRGLTRASTLLLANAVLFGPSLVD